MTYPFFYIFLDALNIRMLLIITFAWLTAEIKEKYRSIYSFFLECIIKAISFIDVLGFYIISNYYPSSNSFVCCLFFANFDLSQMCC